MKQIDTFLYIDNTNIKKGAENHFSNSVRFDFYSFEKMSIENNFVKKAIIGSEYSEERIINNSFLIKMENMGYDVQFFSRNGYGEKKVDTQLTGLAVKDIISYSGKAKIIILSGDQDYIPVVNLAIEKGWVVEIWGFRGDVSGSYKRKEGVTVFYIDDYSDELLFFKGNFCTGLESHKEHRQKIDTESHIQEDERVSLFKKDEIKDHQPSSSFEDYKKGRTEISSEKIVGFGLTTFVAVALCINSTTRRFVIKTVQNLFAVAS